MNYKILLLITNLIFLSCSPSVVKPEITDINDQKIANTDKFLKALNQKYNGYYYSSIQSFKKILKNEDNPWVAKEIADCFLKLERFDSTKIYLERAEKKIIDNEELLLIKINLLNQLDDKSSLSKTLEKIIRISPENLSYRNLYFDLLHKMKKYEVLDLKILEAIEYYKGNEAIVKELFLKRAAYTTLDQNYQKAKKIYQDYLENINNNDADILFRLCRLYILDKELDKAYSLQKRILELNPENIQNYNIMALILQLQNNEIELIDFLQESLAKFPDNLDFKIHLGDYFAERNDLEKANFYFDPVLKSDSLDVNIYNEIAMSFDRMGQKIKASKIYKKAYTKFPENDRILNNYAYILSELNQDLSLALMMINKALKNEDSLSSYVDTKSWILFKQNKITEALEFNNKALEVVKNEQELPVILYHKAMILIKLNRIDEARGAILKSYNLLKHINNNHEQELIRKLYQEYYQDESDHERK